MTDAASELPADLTPNPASPDEAESTVADRVVYALRPAGFLAVALLVAGLVTERLRPPEGLDRGIASTPFLWAIVIWFVVLLFHAIAFERSQMQALERTPLYAALGVAGLLFVIGLISFGDGDIGRRIIYLFANALGAVMFWWSLFGLGLLMVNRLKT